MLRGVIFDMDGVVVDSHPAHKRAWQMLLLSLQKPVSGAELEFVVEGHKRSEILRHFLGDLTEEEAARHGAAKEKFFEGTSTEIKTIHGFDKFFQQVEDAGLICGLASSAGRSRVERTLQHLNLKRRFHTVVAGDDVTNGKPDPAIFQLAASHMQLSNSEVIVCEDAVSGVHAARKAGMKCLALATPGRAKMLLEAGADHVVPDFSHVSLGQLQHLFLALDSQTTSTKTGFARG
jgi:beta-phosphoglucomutase